MSVSVLPTQPQLAPHSEDAEVSVIGQMLAKPDCIGSVTATLLEGHHFYFASHATLFEAIVEAFFADDPIDPLSIAESRSKVLARLWGVEERFAVQKVTLMAAGRSFAGDAADHAHVVKKHADLRALLDLSAMIVREVETESQNPDQIAGLASSEAMKIATNSVIQHEVVHFADAGRDFVREMRRRVAMKQAGQSVGAKFGIGAIDQFTMGLQPTELLIGGGEAGVGKSSVWWACGQKFAEKQAVRDIDDRVGTLVLSLEMGDTPSSTRWAQSLTGIDGARMRDGDLSQGDLRRIVEKWGAKKDLPLWLNYASGLRLSQLRAIVSEGIRKHNVGLVIIDHFLLLYPDTRMDQHEADDERVRFLKNQIAKDLNVAVICLAHTRKAIERADKRPRMADLRGSGMIAAFADFVALMFRPYEYASDKDRDGGRVHPNDAEMLWVKNRHGIGGTGNFYFDPSRQNVV